MAGTQGNNIGYFRHNAGRFNDTECRTLVQLYGIGAYGLYFYLYERAVRERGRLQFDNTPTVLVEIAARDVGMSSEEVLTIVESMVTLGMFDKAAWKKGVLTSDELLEFVDKVEKERERDLQRKHKGQEYDAKSGLWLASDRGFNVLEEFTRLWKLYPRPEGRVDALKHFNAQVAEKADLQDLEKAIRNYDAGLDKKRTDWYKYTLHGSTFFNRRWRDYVNAKPGWKGGITTAKVNDTLLSELNQGKT